MLDQASLKDHIAFVSQIQGHYEQYGLRISTLAVCYNIYLNCDVENGRILSGIVFALIDLSMFAMRGVKYIENAC